MVIHKMIDDDKFRFIPKEQQELFKEKALGVLEKEYLYSSRNSCPAYDDELAIYETAVELFNIYLELQENDNLNITTRKIKLGKIL